MERDFLGGIGWATRGGAEAVKEETRAEPGTPPAAQWPFPAKSSAAPALMSFRAARDEGAKEFSISGFRPGAAGDAFDGVRKQASLPAAPHQQLQRQFGLGTQAAAHHLHGGSRMVQPLSARHPAPFGQASPMLRSQSFNGGSVAPFRTQPLTMSNGFGGSTVGVYGARNPRNQTSTQLTIFYNGSVNVFDNVPVEKAKELMMLASRASIPSPPSAARKPDSPVSAPAKVAAPEVLPVRQIVIQKPEPSVPHLSSTASPIPIVPQTQVLTLSRNTANCATESTGPRMAAQPPVVAPTSQASSSHQPMPLATTTSAAIMPRAVPQARKASLARFLEKRKERVTSAEPYPTSKSPKGSSDTIGSASAPAKSSSTDIAPASNNSFGQPRNISFSEACPSTELQI